MLRRQPMRRLSILAGHLSAKTNPLLHSHPQFHLYEGPVEVEFDHVRFPAEKEWLHAEYSRLMLAPTHSGLRENLLRELLMNEAVEHFLQKKFSMLERYSGEGTECLTPCLWALCTEYESLALPKSEVVISTQHRGKLAALVSLLDFPARFLFAKIESDTDLPDSFNPEQYCCVRDISALPESRKGKLRVISLQNPSHLEINGPVGLGWTRAQQDRGANALHIWLHGDAGVAGQGVVYEATQTVRLPSYATGGSIHVVINNQIGFTTTPKDARSTQYATDVFKIIGAPVLHVNGMFPEEVYKMAQLAVRYRQRFQSDVVIEIVGYRRHGHHESDEPSFTNPLMYKTIREEMKGCATVYAERLIKNGTVTTEVVKKMRTQLDEYLQSELEASLKADTSATLHGGGHSTVPRQPDAANLSPVCTGYDLRKLVTFAEVSVAVPKEFSVHPVLKNSHIQHRLELLKRGLVDWPTAEAMAFGSLLDQGHNVRLSGQDSIRGTFSQRHAAFYCQSTEKQYFPFKHFFPARRFDAINSPLSELSILGFEYGYSLGDTESLVLWEAQYGDFANMAQPVIDIYVSGGGEKWNWRSALVMLLPHGQEGMGAEHSSARLERFLQLVDHPLDPSITNISVCCPVSPANYFHLLRRQLMSSVRRPLIIAAPKSSLRHPLALSSLSELAPGCSFQAVIEKEVGAGSSSTLILCAGKVSLDLQQRFSTRNFSLTIIEQLAPCPIPQLKRIIDAKKQLERIVWVQEEPYNQGCCNYLLPILTAHFTQQIYCVSLPSCATSAAGKTTVYKHQMKQLFTDVEKYLE